MAIDFSRLNGLNRNSPIEPRDIFMSLPNKKKEYNYPCDVQTEVWNQWFESRNEKNIIILLFVTILRPTNCLILIFISCSNFYCAYCTGRSKDIDIYSLKAYTTVLRN